MPGQISLDDSSFEELYGQAMERLRRQAPWWTHTEVSDPGIMLAEMWAMLTDMQSFYLDQVQESHYRKYLKLLGIRPEEGECARTWVFFEQVGEERTVPAGTKVRLVPGESITIYPYMYHDFHVEEGSGDVLLGEVSMCNDDENDNRFYEPIGRFPEIEEDEEPYRLLCNEYPSEGIC